ncbi:MAG TPA: FKBP-type peptidyl-prolyl cis-trans isomerase [Rhizomicrobium sp.]|nr:FKBP-type peptidyl-prolyl cis-trans isomerase [Rhizomicrobium sp.]
MMKLSVAFLLLTAMLSPVCADDGLSAAANRSFLADNANKPGVRSLPSGLEYRVLKNGFGGHPTQSDFAEFSFSARLISGKLVDSASPDLPANLQVSNLMRGLNEALLRMQVGDRWELAVPPDLALGAKGNASVPPNQTLVIDLTLMAVVPPQQAQSSDSSPFSVYGYNRGVEHQAGAMFTLRQ